MLRELNDLNLRSRVIQVMIRVMRVIGVVRTIRVRR